MELAQALPWSQKARPRGRDLVRWLSPGVEAAETHLADGAVVVSGLPSSDRQLERGRSLVTCGRAISRRQEPPTSGTSRARLQFEGGLPKSGLPEFL